MVIEYFQKSKEQVVKEGYPWRDKVAGEYKITLMGSDLADDIKNVTDDIIKEIIQCNSCKNPYRIIGAELGFYRRFSIPLPRLCFSCRHLDRRRKKNPSEIWHRKCQCVGVKSLNGVYSNIADHQHGDGRCLNEFETSYAPDRPEIVYCEQCYQQEVL